MRYLTDYSTIIHWDTGCAFFDKIFQLKNRVRKNIDDVTGEDGKIQKRRRDEKK